MDAEMNVQVERQNEAEVPRIREAAGEVKTENIGVQTHKIQPNETGRGRSKTAAKDEKKSKSQKDPSQGRKVTKRPASKSQRSLSNARKVAKSSSSKTQRSVFKGGKNTKTGVSNTKKSVSKVVKKGASKSKSLLQKKTPQKKSEMRSLPAQPSE